MNGFALGRRDGVCVFLLAAVSSISVASAQGVSAGLGLGIAVPTGRLGAERLPGPIVQAFATLGDAERRVRLQLGAEGVWIQGKGDSSPLSSVDGDFRSLALVASVIVAPKKQGVRPYATAGAAIHRLSIEEQTNPYGAIPGARGGIGFEAPWRRQRIRGEVSAHAILSDFGTGRDWAMGSYSSITVGILF